MRGAVSTSQGDNLTDDQLSSRALVRLACDPPKEIGDIQRRTCVWHLRPFPLGLRFSGKNMSPLPCWLAGAQHVACAIRDWTQERTAQECTVACGAAFCLLSLSFDPKWQAQHGIATQQRGSAYSASFCHVQGLWWVRTQAERDVIHCIQPIQRLLICIECRTADVFAQLCVLARPPE